MCIQNDPAVTIAIPAYNEAKHIKSVLLGFLNQQYPQLIEILVADGGSTDGTQRIVNQIAQKNTKVRLLDNPQKIQSAALNLMLQEAKGSIFLRADAHSDYAQDYIQKCVENLVNTKALNVGGAQRFIAKNAFQSGVALASRSPLGNGNAKYRDPQYTGYADTVYIGCFWRDVLKEVGGYHLEAVTNQDAELNLRLLEYQSQAIYVSSDIKVWYTPRSNPKSLWIQYFKYGRGRFLTSSKHPQSSPVRTKIPFLIFIFLLVTVTSLTFYLNFFYSLIPVLIIFAILLIESVRVNLKYSKEFEQEIWRGEVEEKPNLMVRIVYCLLSLIIMPIAYVTGNCYQYFKNKILRKSGW